MASGLGLGVDISTCIKPAWEALPKRWAVERSLAWINSSRRVSHSVEKVLAYWYSF